MRPKCCTGLVFRATKESFCSLNQLKIPFYLMAKKNDNSILIPDYG